MPQLRKSMKSERKVWLGSSKNNKSRDEVWVNPSSPHWTDNKLHYIESRENTAGTSKVTKNLFSPSQTALWKRHWDSPLPPSSPERWCRKRPCTWLMAKSICWGRETGCVCSPSPALKWTLRFTTSRRLVASSCSSTRASVFPNLSTPSKPSRAANRNSSNCLRDSLGSDLSVISMCSCLYKVESTPTQSWPCVTQWKVKAKAADYWGISQAREQKHG